MVAINYLWNPINDNIVREFDDAGSTIAEYTTEPDLYGNVVSQHRGGETSYLHFDAQGNTTELTNDAGNITDTIRYSAFGEVTERSGAKEIRFQYKGEHGYFTDHLTSELVVRPRILFPNRGHWLSLDPFWLAHSPSTAHLGSPYAYADNSPVVAIDPSGLARACSHTVVSAFQRSADRVF